LKRCDRHHCDARAGEHGGAGGTLLVVAGVVLISWEPDAMTPSYRTWHVLYSLGAGFPAGLAFPLRRYGLTITNEPVFFSLVIATVSLSGTIPYIRWTGSGQGLVWNSKGVMYFLSRDFVRHWGHCSRSSR
jgi:hypothetical protein